MDDELTPKEKTNLVAAALGLRSDAVSQAQIHIMGESGNYAVNGKPVDSLGDIFVKLTSSEKSEGNDEMRQSGRQYLGFLAAIERAERGEHILFWCMDSDRTAKLFAQLTGIKVNGKSVGFPDGGSIVFKTTKEIALERHNIESAIVDMPRTGAYLEWSVALLYQLGLVPHDDEGE